MYVYMHKRLTQHHFRVLRRQVGEVITHDAISDVLAQTSSNRLALNAITAEICDGVEETMVVLWHRHSDCLQVRRHALLRQQGR